MIMKRLFDLFYTTPCKTLLVVSMIICSWLMNAELMDMLNLYKQDSVALINVFVQGKSYDYQSSYFLRNEIETAIEDVLAYSMVYNRNADKSYVDTNVSGSEDYNETAARLRKLRNFRFAVVNHKTDIIISNIPALNGKSPEVTVRRYFGEEKNILIVRDAKTPYYESGTMSEYVEFVSEQAQKYSDDFDVYISFGDNLEFTNNSEGFSQRHSDALAVVASAFNTIAVYLGVLFVLFVTIVAVSGKREFGGKTYPSLNDRLPNDLTVLLYIVVYISMSALYENSIYMALRVTGPEDYWLSYSSEFYMARSDISMVIMIMVITAFCCALKRQIGCGTLITNTYIYKAIKNFKKSEPSA